jgi:hypothetical protein
MFGFWPSCSYNGCPLPALFQFRNTRDESELWVDLCFKHLTQAQMAVAEMQSLRVEAEKARLTQENFNGQE